MGKTLTNEEFIAKLKASRPNLQSLEEYKGYDVSIKMKCNNCGYEFYAKPTILLYRKALFCKQCSSWKSDFDNRENNFIKKLSHFNENVDVVGEYINQDTEILCRCKIHDIYYKAKPNNLLRHISCPICKKENKSKLYRKLPFNDDNSFKNVIDEYKNENLVILGDYFGDDIKIKCKCLVCNSIVYKTPRNIYNGSLHGSCENSKGEREISKILSKYNIVFETRKIFTDLFGVGGGYLSYDFYLPLYNILIEYQGEQHERPVDYFGGYDRFEIQLEHDKRKRSYAFSNKIELIEIWYYQFNNIEDILIQNLNINAA